MAKGTHECNCPSCGKAIKIECTKRNSTEARNWEEYMAKEEHYCYACNVEGEQERKGMVAKEMPYGEYKENFADCKKVPGSYNSETKTIKVYVPAEPTVTEETIAAIKEIIKAAHAAFDDDKTASAENIALSHKVMDSAEGKIYKSLQTGNPQETVKSKLDKLISALRAEKNNEWRAVSWVCGEYVHRK